MKHLFRGREVFRYKGKNFSSREVFFLISDFQNFRISYFLFSNPQKSSSGPTTLTAQIFHPDILLKIFTFNRFSFQTVTDCQCCILAGFSLEAHRLLITSQAQNIIRLCGHPITRLLYSAAASGLAVISKACFIRPT